MRHLIVAAALVAATPAPCQPLGAGGDQDYGSPGATGGGPSGPLPLYDAPATAPQRAWPELAPYPRTAVAPLPYVPPLNPADERIKQLEQQNRILSLEWQQRVFEDALRRMER